MNNPRLLTGLLAAVLSGAPAWTQERHMSLPEIFTQAETAGRQLRPYEARRAEAAHALDLARTARLPQIEASLALSFIGDGFTTSRNFSDLEKAPIPHLGNGLSLSVSQPLFTGGAISRSIDAAEIGERIAATSEEMHKDELRLRLALSYFELCKQTNIRSIIEKNISRTEKVIDEMHARLEQGTILNNDITRYELLLTDLRFQLTRCDNTLSIINDGIVTLSGLPSSTVIVPDTVFADPAPVDISGGLEENSPSMSLRRAEIELSENEERLARSKRLPTLGLRAEWSINGPILTEVPPIDRNLSYWFVGLTLNYDLSSLWRSPIRIAGSRAATASARYQYDADLEQLHIAVNEAYVRWQEAYTALDTRRKALALAEQNYSVVYTRYSAGTALITDLMDAENARLDAERQLANSSIDIHSLYYRLLYLTGTI